MQTFRKRRAGLSATAGLFVFVNVDETGVELYWLQSVRDMINSRGKSYIIVLMSEIFPDKLCLFTQVDAWVHLHLSYEPVY